MRNSPLSSVSKGFTNVFMYSCSSVTSTGPIIERLLIEIGVIAGISTAIQPQCGDHRGEIPRHPAPQWPLAIISRDIEDLGWLRAGTIDRTWRIQCIAMVVGTKMAKTFSNMAPVLAV